MTQRSLIFASAYSGIMLAASALTALPARAAVVDDFARNAPAAVRDVLSEIGDSAAGKSVVAHVLGPKEAQTVLRWPAAERGALIVRDPALANGMQRHMVGKDSVSLWIRLKDRLNRIAEEIKQHAADHAAAHSRELISGLDSDLHCQRTADLTQPLARQCLVRGVRTLMFHTTPGPGGDGRH